VSFGGVPHSFAQVSVSLAVVAVPLNASAHLFSSCSHTTFACFFFSCSRTVAHLTSVLPGAAAVPYKPMKRSDVEYKVSLQLGVDEVLNQVC
jgi:hypothetical protein